MPEYAIERDPLLADTRPDTLAKRVEAVLGTLASATGTKCHRCTRTVCAHDVLASLVLGFQSEPRCAGCLSKETDRDAAVLRDELTAFALSKDCLTIGWRWAARRDAHCEWSGIRLANGGHLGPDNNGHSPGAVLDAPSQDAEWNAGELSCGELVLELRRRMRALPPGSIIKVTALDPAAPEDMPAWCRLTGHALVHARHPSYFIRRKEN